MDKFNIYDKLFVISTIAGILVCIIALIYIGSSEVEYEIGKCYDNKNSEIIGLKCINEIVNLNYIYFCYLIVVWFIVTMLLLIVVLVHD